MSNLGLVIEERAADIGGFLVGRLLPFREKRAVGPFVFIDHMGPATLPPHQNFDIGPHPHIGLSTLTYLFEGAVHHRDSIGSDVIIEPGAVNWMTAGKGVVHSERTPQHLRNAEKSMHGFQIWVAMPKELEQMPPSFTHIEEKDIPTWIDGGVSFKLIAGNGFGKKSPVPVYSELYFIEIKNTQEQKLNLGKKLFGESAIYVLDGHVRIDGQKFGTAQLLVSQNAELCEFVVEANSTIYIFGGEPLPEQRFIFWNFVSSDPEIIEKAKRDWEEQRFPKIDGETGYIPLPAPVSSKR